MTSDINTDIVDPVLNSTELFIQQYGLVIILVVAELIVVTCLIRCRQNLDKLKNRNGTSNVEKTKVFVEIDRHNPNNPDKPNENQVTPLTIQPCQDKKAAVVSILIEQPSAKSSLAIGSTLISMERPDWFDRTPQRSFMDYYDHAMSADKTSVV